LLFIIRLYGSFLPCDPWCRPRQPQRLSRIEQRRASWVNAIGGAISGSAGGRAGGVPVAAGSMYRVGEGGRPELFDQGGKTYLIPGDAGSVRPITAGMPASSLGGGGGIIN